MSEYTFVIVEHDVQLLILKGILGVNDISGLVNDESVSRDSVILFVGFCFTIGKSFGSSPIGCCLYDHTWFPKTHEADGRW